MSHKQETIFLIIANNNHLSKNLKSHELYIKYKYYIADFIRSTKVRICNAKVGVTLVRIAVLK